MEEEERWQPRNDGGDDEGRQETDEEDEETRFPSQLEKLRVRCPTEKKEPLVVHLP